MKLGSQELINSFNELIIRSDLKLKIGSYMIKNENVDEISIETKIDTDKRFFGKIGQSFLNISLKGTELMEIPFNKGDEIVLEIGNIVNANEYLLGVEEKRIEYFKFIPFEITENVEKSLEENRIKINARDNVYKLFKLYEKPQSNLKLIDLIKYILNKNSISFDSNYIDLIKNDLLNIEVKQNQYGEKSDEKTTYYDVLSDCLEIIGCIAFNSSENLKILPLKNSNIPLQLSKNYENFKVINTTFDKPINTVVYRTKNVDGENVTFKVNENQEKNVEYVCEDNGIVNLVETRQKLGAITLEKVKDLAFPSFEVTRLNKPYLEIGDKLEVNQMEYTIGHSLIKWNGALNCSFGLSIEEKQEETIRQNKPITRLIQDTKLEVKKDIQEIQIEITRVNEEVNQVKQTFSPTQIETTITNITNSKISEIVEERITQIQNTLDETKTELSKELVAIGDSPPTNKNFWIDTNIMQLKTKVNDVWVTVGSSEEVKQLLNNRLSVLEGKSVSKEEMIILSSQFLQYGNDFETYKKIITGQIKDVKNEVYNAKEILDNLQTSIIQDAHGLMIKNNQSSINVRLGNNKLQFLDNGVEVAYISNQKLFITSGVFVASLQIGNYKFSQSEDGEMLYVDFVGILNWGDE